MKEIPLTQGKVALVDDEDFDILNQYKWCAAKTRKIYYAVRALPREKGVQKLRYMHHDLLGNVPLGLDVDHVNGNGLDNQRGNLRRVTRRQNIQNLHIAKSSRYPGVTWCKSSRAWMAQANINGKHKFLGYSKSEEVAFEKYRNAINETGAVILEAHE